MSRNVAAGSPATADDDILIHLHGRRKSELTEFLRRYEAGFRATARRFAASAEDAEDAYQRAVELLITKGPNKGTRVRISWMHTVVRREALRLRRQQEWTWASGDTSRLEQVSGSGVTGGAPPEGRDPAEVYEHHDSFGRFRQSFLRLKPDEQRALCLIGEGYSYKEIGELTGWSWTKINRSLAEGRARMRRMLEDIESGRRCAQLAGPLSRLCDGEASEAEKGEVQDHLAVCLACRATLSSFKTTPRHAAALFPALPASPSLSDRVQELSAWVQASVSGRTGLNEAAVTMASGGGGTRGGGMAALAKLAIICVGAGGGTAACLATGVLPTPASGVERQAGKENGRGEQPPSAPGPSSPISNADAPAYGPVADQTADAEEAAQPGEESPEHHASEKKIEPPQAIAEPVEAEFGPESAGISVSADESPSPQETARSAQAIPRKNAVRPAQEPATSAPIVTGPASRNDEMARPPVGGGEEFAP